MKQSAILHKTHHKHRYLQMIKYIIGLVILLAIALTISVKSCNDNKIDKIRFRDNQTALMGKVKFYRDKDSLSVADVQKLTLTKKELEDNRDDLVKTIYGLNIKLKRVQSASTTETETKYQVKTPIRDSLVYLDGKTIILKCINYSNEWLTIDGCTQDGSFNGVIKSKDKITQVVYGIPHHFWFIKWGVKSIRQTVKSHNPFSTIIFDEYIELTK